MKITILVVALLIGAAAAGVVSRPDPSLLDKIVGGYIVEKGAHKYQVHLRLTMSFFGLFSQTSWGCGGSIINSRWILTAAHCIHNMDGKVLAASAVKVRTGQHDSSILESHARNYDVVRVIPHPEYNKGAQFIHDVALLELSEDIQFNDHTAIVPLAASGSAPEDGRQLFVSGWGTTTWQGAGSQLLRAVGVHVVNKETCNQKYSNQIKAGMLCAAADGKDSCQGDSGGPLVQVDANGVQTQVGVVSWGNECAHKDFPGVYANVGDYVSWIEQTSGLDL